MSDKEIWVLTEECNSYHQHNISQVEAFLERPSVRDLMKASKEINENTANVLLNTGESHEKGSPVRFTLEKHNFLLFNP